MPVGAASRACPATTCRSSPSTWSGSTPCATCWSCRRHAGAEPSGCRAGGAGASLVIALVDDIAADGHGLVMLMGKGGVGKTTLAAAVAVELARRGLPVHLTTSDPAAHLADTLDGALPNLKLSRIDPHAEATARYREHVLADQGRAARRRRPRPAGGRPAFALHRGDRRVPGLLPRSSARRAKSFVVMDTAPTGHTLLLLDATGAYHREIARQMGDKGVHFTTPMMQLQDPQADQGADRHPGRNHAGAGSRQPAGRSARAGIEPWAWVINNSVAAARPLRPAAAPAARNEAPRSTPSPRSTPQRYAVVPLLQDEPVGVERLLALAGHSLEKV
jgi:arsenite-transporting ATPase